MSIVVSTENLSKRYRLGVINRRYLYKDLQSWFAKATRRPDPNTEVDARVSHDRDGIIWALEDVNIEIKDGDVVGIIGRNGSGKSTLLKILSRITSPTKGTALVKGRVASLLEVGTGFHPELTGRDNVYLNGSILGMPKSLIDKKFDEIVDFAGVSDFIDTPVKRYSSGMRVRLAFAVAAHLEPDILIVDEVLAVGDAEFQKKCLGRIGEAAKSGRTILFVSHNAAAVENLCSKGIVMDGGRTTFSGSQTQALDFYFQASSSRTKSLADRTDRKGTGEIRIIELKLKNGKGQETNCFSPSEPVRVELIYANPDKIKYPHIIVGIAIKSHLDVLLFYGSNYISGDDLGQNSGKDAGCFVCRLPNLPLMPGSYRLDFTISSQPKGAHLIDSIENAADFEILTSDYYHSGQLPPAGVVLTPMKWTSEA